MERYATYVNGPYTTPNSASNPQVHTPFTQQLLIVQKELLSITDTYVESTLRSQDTAQGKWLVEDPSLSQIQQALMRR